LAPPRNAKETLSSLNTDNQRRLQRYMENIRFQDVIIFVILYYIIFSYVNDANIIIGVIVIFIIVVIHVVSCMLYSLILI